MATRIELDTKALASLIGGDSEVELHLRKQIVCEFTRQHLVNLVHDEAFKKVASDIKSQVSDILKNEYGIGTPALNKIAIDVSNYSARGQIRDMIKNIVQEELAVAMQKMRSEFDSWLVSNFEVWKRIANSQATLEIKNEIRKGIAKALEKAIGDSE